VSVAKATIVATLPAKTSILAAANPKLGRFDPLKSIHDQIDIPETLLSRFDLKFALMDIPNIEIDTKMAEHILKSMEPTYEKAIPLIDPKFLRKYVAYARKNIFPTMPEDVGEMIKKFYLEMRNKSVGRGIISITARQFEALRRLSEASAKVRLSPVVTAEDANRAIRLLQYSLQQLGLDRETGLIDIDRAEGGISSSQRNKIRIIIDIVDELTREVGKVISLDDIISAAEQEGISASDAVDVIDSLKRDGQIIEPKFRHVQKV
jgi:replicative DNA helicase Mcm